MPNQRETPSIPGFEGMKPRRVLASPRHAPAAGLPRAWRGRATRSAREGRDLRLLLAAALLLLGGAALVVAALRNDDPRDRERQHQHDSRERDREQQRGNQREHGCDADRDQQRPQLEERPHSRALLDDVLELLLEVVLAQALAHVLRVLAHRFRSLPRHLSPPVVSLSRSVPDAAPEQTGGDAWIRSLAPERRGPP